MSRVDPVSDLHPYAIWLQMRIESEKAPANIFTDEVTAACLWCDRDRSFARKWHVFRDAILHRHDSPLRDGEHICAEPKPAIIFVAVSFEGHAIRADFYEVVRVPLRIRCAAVIWEGTTAVN